MGTGKTLSWIVALAGLWVLISPFILGFSGISSAMVNDVVVGIVLIVLGLISALYNRPTTDRTLDWISAIVGLWLLISPFVLGYSVLSLVAMWNAIILGIIVIILSVWASVEFRAPTPHPM